MTKTLAQYIFAEETLYNNGQWTMDNGQLETKKEERTITNNQQPIISAISNQQSAVSNPKAKNQKPKATISNPKSQIALLF